MGGLFDALVGGGNALQAQQLGAQVSGSNVNNVNAPGYHREEPRLVSGSAQRGVIGAHVERAVSALVDAQVGAQRGALAAAQARADGLGGLQPAAAALGPEGLGAALGDFFNAWRGVAASPADLAARGDALARLQALTQRVGGAAAAVAGARDQADGQIVAALPELNAQIAAVAQLNLTIAATEAQGQPAPDLRDRRDLAVQALAEAVGATALTDPRGQTTVLVGGVSVVSGGAAYPLEASLDVASGVHALTVAGTTQGPLDGRIDSGAVGGLLQLRDSALPAQAAQLDQFAADFGAAVNGVHSAYVGLDGAGGRPLVAPHALAGAAQALAVAPAVAGNPAALGTAASSATLPGDNSGASAMVALQASLVATAGSQTLDQALATQVGAFGNLLAQARADSGLHTANLAQVKALAESQQGVSIEAQMLQLSRFQNAYQAATRVVSAVDRMLDALERM